MALQLTGAYKRSALANLQVRLPAVVIGGGLTAIDTATELLAYYIVQVEKTADRIDALVAERGEAAVMAMFDEEEREFLAEQRAPRRARCAPSARAAAQRGPRARLPAAPRRVGRRLARLPEARRRLAGLPPQPRGGHQVARGGRALRREPGAGRGACSTSAAPSQAMTFERQALDGRQVEGRPARSSSCRRAPCCVAAGTSPNVTYEKEQPGLVRVRQVEAVLPAAHAPPSTTTGKLVVEPAEPRGGLLHELRRRRARASATTATTTRTTPAASSRRWPARRTRYPHVVALFRRRPRAPRRRAAGRARRAAARPLRARSTTSSSPSCTRSCGSRRPSSRWSCARPRPRGKFSARASSTACRTSR